MPMEVNVSVSLQNSTYVRLALDNPTGRIPGYVAQVV